MACQFNEVTEVTGRKSGELGTMPTQNVCPSSSSPFPLPALATPHKDTVACPSSVPFACQIPPESSPKSAPKDLGKWVKGTFSKVKEALKRTPYEGTKSAQETPQDSEGSGDESSQKEDKKALKLVPFEGFQFQESPRGTPPLSSPKGPARPQFFVSSGVETPPLRTLPIPAPPLPEPTG